jgi:hypothetical protein
METDNRFFIPWLQPEIAGNPTVPLLNANAKIRVVSDEEIGA